MICGGCGNNNADGMRYCTSCGLPLQEAVVAAEAPPALEAHGPEPDDAAPGVVVPQPVDGPPQPAPTALPTPGAAATASTPAPPPTGSQTTARPGIIAQFIAAGIAFLVWIFSDKRRAIVAGGLVVTVLLGNWWIQSRPAAKADICSQASTLKAYLESSTSTFDNRAFTLANRLGDAAAKADPGEGGNTAAIHSAGRQLQSLGRGSGIIQSASLYQFDEPLSQILSWCATDTTPMAEAPAVQDAPIAVDTPTDTPADASTDTYSPSSSLPKALDSCATVNDEVTSNAGARFTFDSEPDNPIDDLPAGLTAGTTCNYTYNDATLSNIPLTVSLQQFDNDEDLVSALQSMGAPDPGQAAEPGMSAVVTYTSANANGGSAAIARKGDLVVIVTEDNPNVGLSDATLSDIASTTMGYWSPA